MNLFHFSCINSVLLFGAINSCEKFMSKMIHIQLKCATKNTAVMYNLSTVVDKDSLLIFFCKYWREIHESKGETLRSNDP